MSDTLPNGWATPQLEDLMEFVIGGDWGKDPDFKDDDFVEAFCIRGTEFRHWNQEKGVSRVLRKIKLSSLEKRALKDGDILIEISGGGPDQPVGRTVHIDSKSLAVKPEHPTVCTNFIRLSRPYTNIDSRYVNYYLQTFYLSGEVTNYQGGSNNLRNLKFKEYCTIPVPFAPLNEQIRIADKLDSLLAKVDTAQKHLDKIPVLIKRFRQSVLAAATSGELTKEWRVRKNLSISIDEINQAYKKGIIIEKNNEYKVKGKFPKSDSWKNNIPTPHLPTQEDIERFGIYPKNWEFVSLDQLTRFVKDGPHFSPNYTEEGIPFISGRNVTQDGIDFSTCKYISRELHNEFSKRCKPLKGDILYTKGGTTGIACVNTLDTEFNVWVHVAVLRVTDENVIHPSYVSLALNSPKCYERSQFYTHGVANRDLGLKRMIKICFAIPNIEEQKEIVRRVESLFALADTVEKQYQQAQKRIDRLTQSILAKAFRGELVPQDPNDEPAEELLKRIQAEREAQKPVKKGKRKTNSRTKKSKKTDMKLEDAPENYLLDLLKKLNNEAYAEELWKKSGLCIDDFYAKLKQEMIKKPGTAAAIVEDKDSSDPSLRKLKVAKQEG